MQPLGREVFEDAVIANTIVLSQRRSHSAARIAYIAISARQSASTLRSIKLTLHRRYSVKVDRADVVMVVSSFLALSSRGVRTLVTLIGSGTAVCSVIVRFAGGGGGIQPSQ